MNPIGHILFGLATFAIIFSLSVHKIEEGLSISLFSDFRLV